MDSLTEDSLNSKGLKFPGKGKTEKSINIAESYTECRKEAGPITCTIATGAKEVTNHAVLVAGNTVIATGLASSKFGIGLPLVVSGVGNNRPYQGQAIYIDKKYKFVKEVRHVCY